MSVNIKRAVVTCRSLINRNLAYGGKLSYKMSSFILVNNVFVSFSFQKFKSACFDTIFVSRKIDDTYPSVLLVIHKACIKVYVSHSYLCIYSFGSQNQNSDVPSNTYLHRQGTISRIIYIDIL